MNPEPAVASLDPQEASSHMPDERRGHEPAVSRRVGDKVEGGRVRRPVHGAHVPAGAYEPDARARAVLRGRTFAEADLRAAGGTYGLDEVRVLLNGISRQAVDKRVNEGALLAVPGPHGARRFPTAQFDEHGGVVDGLKAVSKALGASSPWAVLNFLVNGNDGLAGRRPIDVLRDGQIEPVVAAAVSIGQQGA